MTTPRRPAAPGADPIAAAQGTMPAADPGTPEDTPMTDRQAAELRMLTDKTGEAFDTALTKRQAAERIAYLRERAGKSQE